MKAESLEKIELERTALHMSFLSLLQQSLRTAELTAEGVCHPMAQCFTTQPDEGRRALAWYCAALLYQSAIQFQFLGKELVMHLAFPERQEKLSLTRVSGGASGTLPATAFSNPSSTKPPKRTSRSLSSPLLSIFMILMVSSLPLTNLSLPSSFRTSMKNELAATCWNKEVEKPQELRNLLGDQELEELLEDKSFPLDHLHDHLGKENLWSVQL